MYFAIVNIIDICLYDLNFDCSHVLRENVSGFYVNLLRLLTCLRWGGVSGPRTYKAIRSPAPQCYLLRNP